MSFLWSFTYDESDILTSDRFLEFSRVSNADYVKIDFFYYGCHPFNWRGQQHPTCPPSKQILITGHGDFPVTKEIFEKKRVSVKKWFSTNIEYNHPDLKSVPLGITNNTNETHVHPIYGDNSLFFDVLKEPFQKKNLLYMNFDENTYPQERRPLKAAFAGKPWVTEGKPEPTREGRRRFLQDIYRSKFVLCPRGNGIDTHRLWETLYMRSIPIVKRHLTHKGLEDLPILFVDSWDEVTEDYLEFKWLEMASRSWNFEKLKMSWWKNYILSFISHDPLTSREAELPVLSGVPTLLSPLTSRMNVLYPRLSVKDALEKAPRDGVYDGPVMFHAYWDGQLAEKHLTSLKSCWYHNVRGRTDRKIIIWTAPGSTPNDFTVKMSKYAEIRQFDKIKEQAGTPLEGEKFFVNPRPSLYSDVVRYTLLHKYGGVWFDLDIFFTRSLDPLLVKYTDEVLVYEWEDQNYPNGALFICLEAHSPKLTTVIEYIKKRNLGWGFQDYERQINHLTFDLPLPLTVMPCGWVDPMWLSNQRGLHFNDFFSPYVSKHTMDSLFPGAFCIHWHNQFSKEPHAISPYAQLRDDLEAKMTD